MVESLEIRSEDSTDPTGSERSGSYFVTSKYIRWILFLVAGNLCYFLVVGFPSVAQGRYFSSDTTKIVTTVETPVSSYQTLRYDQGAPCYRNRSSVNLEFGSTVQFIFTMGLEGTGHHWMKTIVKNSPAQERLTEYNVWPGLAKTFETYLFGRDKKRNITGLTDAHCGVGNENSASLLQESLAAQMQRIEDQVNGALKKKQQQGYQVPTNIPYPVNTVIHQISYPALTDDCRPLNYPDLNLIYDACRQAKVDCLQVYIYRHPVDILSSILRRHFGPNDTSSVHLYTTNLHVLASQLHRYATRTLGCFDLFESNHERSETWKEAQLDLWDWKDDVERYNHFLNETYQKPSSSKTAQNAATLEAWLNDKVSGPYFKSWWRQHNHAISTCSQAVWGDINGGFRGY